MGKKPPKKKKPTVDQFLAAPEEVVKNKTELRKLKDRKARDAARLEQERRSKSKKRPSIEDMLGDVVRVAEDPDLNPWHEFRSISRRRYELYGHYPIEFILEHGRFEHIKQMAGLADAVGTRRLLHARTYRSLESHDERYMRRYILPHVDKHPELLRASNKWHLGLSISDLHGFVLDPFTWEAFLDTCDYLQPDVIYFNGDVVDALEISRHLQIPGSSIPLQLELHLVRGLFTEVRETCPKSRIIWGAGNHFIDRLTRYLTQVARGLARINSMRFDRLVNLGDLDIDLVQGGSFVSPPGQVDAKPHRILWEAYMVRHGSKIGKHPAVAELAQWGICGTSGHAHRAGVAYGSTFAHRRLTWMSTPMACVDDAGKWYVKGYAGWQRGFGVFQISPKGRVHHYPVITDSGVAMVEGQAFEARTGLPETERDVRQFWLDRFKLDLLEYL